MTDVICCAKLFTKFQEDAILKNLYLYNLSHEEINSVQLRTLKNKIAAQYLDQYRLRKISPLNFIAPISMMKSASRRKIELGLCGREGDYDLRLPTNTEEIFQLKSRLNRIRGKILENSILKLEWVNRQKHNWQENISLVFGKKYDAIKSSKFCHPQIFLLFTQFLKQDTNKDIQYFLPQDILRQDQQWTALMSFLAKTPYILQGEDFELKNCAYLSRVAVASVWAISIFFSKVSNNGKK